MENKKLLGTAEDFGRYCAVQDWGGYNMLSEEAQDLTLCTKEVYNDIIKNYNEYKKLYKDTEDKDYKDSYMILYVLLKMGDREQEKYKEDNE